MKVKFKQVMFRLLFFNIFLLFFCEYLVYYFVLSQCNWPKIENAKSEQEPVKAMFIADIHMLGPRGHWLDKLRREWQMHRNFQTAITLFKPEIIFILGDIFDEGNFVSDEGFKEYVKRFKNKFYTPKDVILKSLVGNHDIGFHYATHPYLTHRFDEVFDSTGVSLFSIRNVHFILINSIAMESKSCSCDLCSRSQIEIERISKKFECSLNSIKVACKNIPKLNSYSKPIIVQHFPMYRKSDEDCISHDSPVIEKYKERWEVLSKDSSKLIGDLLKPRLAFSGHSHHYCHIKNTLNIEEFTVASFSWRNKNNPSFLLTKISSDKHSIYKCDMPKETTVIYIYVVGFFLSIIVSFARVSWIIRNSYRRIFGRFSSYNKISSAL